MFTRPADVADADVLAAIRRWWRLGADAVEYLPVGFGSHHWIARGARERWFVSVDDLTHDADDGPRAFIALEHAFLAAVALRHRAGLEFVVAPLADTDGAVLRRLGRDHTIALFPFVDGESAPFGEHRTPEARSEMLSLVVRLHEATSHVAGIAAEEDFALPQRAALERALDDVATPWGGGPFSEPAREVVGRNESGIRARLARYDALSGGVAADHRRWVVTHGEPHAANVIRTPAGPRLVDWDTVRIGPPERDLWMVVGPAEDEVRAYEAVTGRTVEPDVLALYHLWWDLTEVATYVAEFRAAHERTADTELAWRELQETAAR